MYCVTFLLVIEPADQVQHCVAVCMQDAIAEHVAMNADAIAHAGSQCASGDVIKLDPRIVANDRA